MEEYLVNEMLNKKQEEDEENKKVVPEYPTHEIKTFQDLASLCTAENVDMLMGNFYGIMRYWVQLKEHNKDNVNFKDVEFLGFTWIDDGLYDIKEPNIQTSEKFKILAEQKK